MDLIDQEHEERREAARIALVKVWESREGAEKTYLDKVAAHRRAVQAEELRIKNGKVRLEGMLRDANRSHGAVEDATAAKGKILAHFVPQETLRAADETKSKLSKSERLYRRAKSDLVNLEVVLKRRDPKTIRGVLRTESGAPKRAKPSPNDPSALPPKLYGDIPNPNKWNSRAERKEYMKKVEESRLICSEKEAVYLADRKAYLVAQEALDAAFEEACRSGE